MTWLADGAILIYRTLRFLWRYARPIFVTCFIVALIEYLPLSEHSYTGLAFLKAIIAVPVGVVMAFARGRRTLLTLALIAVMFALMAGFTAAGYVQTDTAVDSAVLSLFALTAFLVLPEIVPQRVRKDGLSAGRISSLAGIVWRSSLQTFEAVPQRITSLLRRISGRLLPVAAIVAVALLTAPLAIAAGWIDGTTFVRVLALAADAMIGGCIVWFVAGTFGGRAVALTAAVLWVICGARLGTNSFDGTMTPTAVVPAGAAIAVLLQQRFALRSWMVGLAITGLAGLLGFSFPLLALATTITAALTLLAIGAREEFLWASATPFVLVVLGTALCPVRTVEELNSLTNISGHTQELVACKSGCDGGLPWEWFYPSSFAPVYFDLNYALFTNGEHWGNYQSYSIAPGWTAIALAVGGGVGLYRAARFRFLACLTGSIVVGIALALPSHYLGLGLPTLTHLLTAIAPTFEGGAQMALISSFFVALLGGFGLALLLNGAPPIRTIGILVVSTLALLDVIGTPEPHHPAAAFRKMSQAAGIPPGVVLAFYPMLTKAYDAEYDEILRAASRAGDELVNADPAKAETVADLSAPQAAQRLRRLGVRYAIVSLSDYSRRSEILKTAHLVLPPDQQDNSPAWIVPDPSEVSNFQVVRSDPDGVLLLRP